MVNLPRKISDILPTVHADSLQLAIGSADPQLLEYGLNVGYLTKLSVEKERDWFRSIVTEIGVRKDEETPVTLSLVTTNSCNLACSYCFQSESGMRQLPERIMTLSQAVQSFEAVDQMIANGKRLTHLELFGGEPLMPSTRKVVEYAVLEAERRGLVTRATTNGVYLHMFEDLLGPTRIYDLQISLDGSEEFHNNRRVASTGKPTFSRILDNIELAVGLAVDVDIRANIDKRNLEGLVELVELLDSRGLLDLQNVEFSYINVWPDEDAQDSPNSDIFMTRADIDFYLEQELSAHPAVRKVLPRVTPLAAYLEGIMRDPAVRFCGAGTNNLFVSPESLVYSCDEHVGQPEMAVAVIAGSQISTLPLWDVWHDRRVDKLSNCVECSVSLAHGGGCGAQLDPKNLSRYGHCGTFPEDFDNEIRRLAALSY